MHLLELVYGGVEDATRSPHSSHRVTITHNPPRTLDCWRDLHHTRFAPTPELMEVLHAEQMCHRRYPQWHLSFQEAV